MKSFLFLTEWADMMAKSPDKMRLSVYDAVVNYVENGAFPDDLEPVALGYFKKIYTALNDKLMIFQRLTDVLPKGYSMVETSKPNSEEAPTFADPEKVFD